MALNMALPRDISAERLPAAYGSSTSSFEEEVDKIVSEIPNQTIDAEGATFEEINEKVEGVLRQRIKEGDQNSHFLLGQLYFEREDYKDAISHFELSAENGDYQAKFQLSVMLYDGLGCQTNHKRAFELMMEVANSTEKKAQHLVRAAQYNVGRAYYQGYGVRQSDKQAETYWLLAAEDGNPKASIKAQSTLGLFYSRDDERDLQKAFFWHTEACGNGSLESQGAQGVMYLHGFGTKRNTDSAFICLRESSMRGNVYAMGHLVAYYYKRKLYTKTVNLAGRVALFEDDIDTIAKETDCLAAYIVKGISMASFYYARCLQLGLGIQKNITQARKYFSKSYLADPDTCAILQNHLQQGKM